MEPQELIGEYQQRVHAVAEKAQAVQVQIASVRGVETSSDGAVTVTVNAQGALEGVSFGPAAAETALAELAQLIVTTSRKARIRAARAATEAVAPLIGVNSAAMQELQARIPIDTSPDEVVDRPTRDGLNEEQVEQTPGPVTPPPVAPARQSPPRVSDDDTDDAGTGYTRGG